MGKIIKTLDNRRQFIETLTELSKTDDKIIVLIPDVGFNYLSDPNLPFKVINLGVTEQTTTLIAAGLALSGFKVYIYTMINFVLFRPYEMIRNAIICHKANVTLLGVKGSSAYKFLGWSHNMLIENEDIKVCKNLGLRNYIPKNTKEVDIILKKIYNDEKPTYIRL